MGQSGTKQDVAPPPSTSTSPHDTPSSRTLHIPSSFVNHNFTLLGSTMGPASTFFYNKVFKKYSTMAVFAVGVAFMWERLINVNVDNYYARINNGVSLLYITKCYNYLPFQ